PLLLLPPRLSVRPFAFPAPPPPALSPLSLHDALPIWRLGLGGWFGARLGGWFGRLGLGPPRRPRGMVSRQSQSQQALTGPVGRRSEEHTSELQSRFDLVCRLLLEKKKKVKNRRDIRRW